MATASASCACRSARSPPNRSTRVCGASPTPCARSAADPSALTGAHAMTQTWNPDVYAKNARFVSELAGPVVALLAPRPAERILDLGCGDGALTRTLADLGCDVVGVDASEPQVAA